MNIGDNIEAFNANWKFNSNTALNFEQHAKKSIPFYDIGHELIIKFSDFFIKNGSTIYELGSACGKLSYSLAKNNNLKDAQFIAIDIEEDMINIAKDRYNLNSLEYLCEDINLVDFKPSDLIVAYYTVQFIHPKSRQTLIDKIYKSLEWGGAFIMFEKVRANDARFQDIITTLYTDFKLENGYTPEEIIYKTRSLKGVLEPFSSNANYDMLKRSGFKDILTIFKYLNFEGLIAIK
jgi:tRNA (cmo5U34)-methyltransferase